MNKLFVFGTFSEGMIHYKKVEPHVEARETATVRGAAFRLPSGLTVLSNDGLQTVSGELLTLRHHSVLLAILDQFHGVSLVQPDQSLFHRSEIIALTEVAQTEEAFAYTINPKKLPRGATQIDGADWRRSFVDHPPLFARLTERQRTYIQRLGSSSGRDIVPIDLGLYRELMHLEIVIDKGRRLALTPLGQELFRMLS